MSWPHRQSADRELKRSYNQSFASRCNTEKKQFRSTQCDWILKMGPSESSNIKGRH